MISGIAMGIPSCLPHREPVRIQHDSVVKQLLQSLAHSGHSGMGSHFFLSPLQITTIRTQRKCLWLKIQAFHNDPTISSVLFDFCLALNCHSAVPLGITVRAENAPQSMLLSVLQSARCRAGAPYMLLNKRRPKSK